MWLPALGLERVRIAADRRQLDILLDPLQAALNSLNAAIAAIEAEADPLYRDALVDDGCEQVESLLGISFVACQVYMTSVRMAIEDLDDICKRQALPRLALLKADGESILGCGPTLRGERRNLAFAEGLNGAANYWKHHPEWKRTYVTNQHAQVASWPRSGRQAKTVRIVRLLGMRPSTTGNMRNAGRALGMMDVTDLSQIRRRLLAWSDDVLNRARTHVESQRPPRSRQVIAEVVPSASLARGRRAPAPRSARLRIGAPEPRGSRRSGGNRRATRG
jgi:hypothetical protein